MLNIPFIFKGAIFRPAQQLKLLECSRSICCCSDSQKGKSSADSFRSAAWSSTLRVDNVTGTTKECRAVPDSLGPSHKASRFLFRDRGTARNGDNAQVALWNEHASHNGPPLFPGLNNIGTAVLAQKPSFHQQQFVSIQRDAPWEGGMPGHCDAGRRTMRLPLATLRWRTRSSCRPALSVWKETNEPKVSDKAVKYTSSDLLFLKISLHQKENLYFLKSWIEEVVVSQCLDLNIPFL